jgi:hypothetical protein
MTFNMELSTHLGQEPMNLSSPGEGEAIVSLAVPP